MKLRSQLSKRGFRYHGEGMFTLDVGTGWHGWLGISNEAPNEHEIVIGCFSEKTAEYDFLAGKVYETPFHKIRRVKYGPPIFIVHLRLVANLIGRQASPSQTFDDEEVIRAVEFIAEPYLRDGASHKVCLERLDMFCKGLPIYFPSRLVLLKIIGDQVAFNLTVKAFLELENALPTRDLDAEFVSRLRELQ